MEAVPRDPESGVAASSSRSSRILRVAAMGGAGLALVAVIGVVRLRRDLGPEILQRRGHLQAVEWASPEQAVLEGVRFGTLRSTSGLEVEFALRPPSETPSSAGPVRHPVALLLGGHESGRLAVRLVPDVGDLAVVALSYPYQGPPKPKGLAFLAAIPSIQRGIRDTPAAILLALDWLLAEPWVDPDRVELVGVSLGAPFACVAGALDPRFARVWSLHGAGTPARLFERSLRRKIALGPLRRIVARLVSLLAYGDTLAPERWVGRIAPRPFVMVNARDDERLPREAIQALFEGAREPKEILWTEGRHVEPGREAVVAGLVDVVLARIREGDVR